MRRTTVAGNRTGAAYPAWLGTGQTEIDGLFEGAEVVGALGKLARQRERGFADEGGLFVDERVQRGGHFMGAAAVLL
jgi:hypothetical protein